MTYSDETCQASQSIQSEINKLAKASSDEWSKKIRSETWREAVRLKLHKKTDDWCDYKAGTCMCNPLQS